MTSLTHVQTFAGSSSSLVASARTSVAIPLSCPVLGSPVAVVVHHEVPEHPLEPHDDAIHGF